MINFFGLNRFLSKDNLWRNEKERLKVIKRVKKARDCDIAQHVLNVIFPLGFSNYAKYGLSQKVENENPISQVAYERLQSMSEQEMRDYIKALYEALDKQFEYCIAYLYNINQSEPDFIEVKLVFEKKFLKATKMEIAISSFSFIGIIIMVLGVFSLLLNISNIKIVEGLVFPIIVFIVVLLVVSSVFITRGFKVIKNRCLRL